MIPVIAISLLNVTKFLIVRTCCHQVNMSHGTFNDKFQVFKVKSELLVYHLNFSFDHVVLSTKNYWNAPSFIDNFWLEVYCMISWAYYCIHIHNISSTVLSAEMETSFSGMVIFTKNQTRTSIILRHTHVNLFTVWHMCTF